MHFIGFSVFFVLLSVLFGFVYFFVLFRFNVTCFAVPNCFFLFSGKENSEVLEHAQSVREGCAMLHPSASGHQSSICCRFFIKLVEEWQ